MARKKAKKGFGAVAAKYSVPITRIVFDSNAFHVSDSVSVEGLELSSYASNMDGAFLLGSKENSQEGTLGVTLDRSGRFPNIVFQFRDGHVELKKARSVKAITLIKDVVNEHSTKMAASMDNMDKNLEVATQFHAMQGSLGVGDALGLAKHMGYQDVVTAIKSDDNKFGERRVQESIAAKIKQNLSAVVSLPDNAYDLISEVMRKEMFVRGGALFELAVNNIVGNARVRTNQQNIS